ncbi:thioredoxin family protein [Nocardioides sp. TRM66260-LWL]|uniref:TlpA family protein disulfide reductase n=1 Tax=Nocardioides sp. TRM66260-LWL TaxID=2874478 RepID=UPI001CC81053|nr:thioredoxin family protein [Nocardioides sp. TRM66260-LWL]MBZ5734885.1 thioredoxin family protein [Nocardioides sp. TRM66260-LWL]
MSTSAAVLPLVSLSPGPVIALVAVVLALGFGLYRAATDGRFRGTRTLPAQSEATEAAAPVADQAADQAATDVGALVRAALPQEALGERATLLQFSSAFCAPCRATRRVLTEVAELVPGVRHVEVDAESQLQLVRDLGVLRTPTTIVLDGSGVERLRAAGAPRREAVLAGLEQIL